MSNSFDYTLVNKDGVDYKLSYDNLIVDLNEGLDIDVDVDLQAVTDAGNTTTNGFTIVERPSGDVKLDLKADGSITAGGQVSVGGSSASPNIRLETGGNIKTVGAVRAGGNSSSGGEAGAYASHLGFIAAARDDANDAVWRSFTAGDSTEKISMTAGGSINAEGTFTVNNNGKFYRPASKGGDVVGNALLTLDSDVHGVNSNAVSITTDGSITAAGGLNLAGGASGTGDAPGIEVYKNTSEIGKPPLFLNQGNTSGYLITGRNGFTGVNTFTVDVNGGAEFAGHVRSNSQVNIIRNDDLAALQIFSGTALNAETNRITLSANGSINAANTAMFGPGVDVSSTTAYGVKVEVSTNSGNVISQATQLASEFTELYRAYRGNNKVFAVDGRGTVTAKGYSMAELDQL